MEYLIYLVAGLLGVIAHCLFKARDLISDSKRLNEKITFKDYLLTDWFGISASLLSVFIWLLIFGEVGSKYPKIIDYVRCSFTGMGFVGSYVLQKFFSRSKAYIRNVMDEKSNISDNVSLNVPPGDGAVQPGKGPTS